VIAVGAAGLLEESVAWGKIPELSDRKEGLGNCADPAAELRMKEQVDQGRRTGAFVGGGFGVGAHGGRPGLGTYAQWDERLDAQLAAAVMSLQAVKAVELGSGVASATSPGSSVHDEIGYKQGAGFAGFTRGGNHAGGLEGGVSNGEEIRVRG